MDFYGKDSTLFKFSVYSLILGLLFAIFAPSEKTIGKVISLVYLHIGFFAGAIILLLISAVMGLTFLLKRKKFYGIVGEVFFKVAFISWLIYFVLSVAVAYLSWGGVFWEEPRMIIAVRVLFLFIVAFLVDRLLEGKFTVQIFTGVSIFSIFLWIFRYSIIHPRAPIRSSDVTMIKFTAIVSVVLVAFSIILLAISVVGRELGNDSL